ncbi:MAG: HAD family phosphatase [Actinobacteria bacterium]|nr:HAD family phosphatase [Actinomycetota bacterium]
MSLLFIFDMDDVLYDYDWRLRMSAMTDITGLPLDELRRRWWHNDGEWAAEAGGFASAAEYLSAFEKAIGMPVDEAQFVEARAGAMTVWPESLAAVRRASELGTITLLTNNGPLVSKHLRAIAPELVDLFGDHLFTSSDYGARKPDPVVFERVLAAYDVQPENTFFADDMRVNVEGAASLGITTYHFGTPQGLHAAIEEFAAART